MFVQNGGGGVYHIKLGTIDANELQKKSPMLQQKNVTPQVSLTAPNCDHFVPVSLTFLDAITKAKKLIRLSIAQDLMPVSLTKLWQWHLIYYYQTQPNLT